MVCCKFWGQSLFASKGLPNLSKVKSLITGCIWKLSSRRNVSNQDLEFALTSDEVVSSIELSQDQFAQYVSGNVVTLDQTHLTVVSAFSG